MNVWILSRLSIDCKLFKTRVTKLLNNLTNCLSIKAGYTRAIIPAIFPAINRRRYYRWSSRHWRYEHRWQQEISLTVRIVATIEIDRWRRENQIVASDIVSSGEKTRWRREISLVCMPCRWRRKLLLATSDKHWNIWILGEKSSDKMNDEPIRIQSAQFNHAPNMT